MLVGIDLGTTYSLVAVMADDGPVVLPNGLGEPLTPSAVSLGEDGQWLVGAAARARAATHPDRTKLSFKRDIGTPRRYALGGRVMTPLELSSLVLAELKQDAEAALGDTVDAAVITVPAYFGESQRQATRDAAKLAGLAVPRMINEPTAAALVYGLHEREAPQRVVVLDLGGGTFDVTVLAVDEGVVDIEATAGDVALGGDDFDAALVEHVRKTTPELGAVTDKAMLSRLRVACEQAKRRLSQDTEARLVLVDVVDDAGRRQQVERPLTRADVEAQWDGLLQRLVGPVERALRDAGVGPSQVDEVLLVGGATHMPCISRFAADYFGRLANRSLPPERSVAMGAAVQAALLENDASVREMVVRDIAPFTLGVATAKMVGAPRSTTSSHRSSTAEPSCRPAARATSRPSPTYRRPSSSTSSRASTHDAATTPSSARSR